MKNVLIIFMALVSFGISAQNDSNSKRMAHKQMKENFTPEQRADLHTKKMTLALNLNEAQQAKVKALFLKEAKNRPERTERKAEIMTAEQKYTRKSEILDRRIAFKKEMATILTPEQMAKWEQHHEQMRDHKMDKKHSENRKHH